MKVSVHSSLTCRMASKMLLIITYSRMVFWLILSVTCKQFFFVYIFVMFFVPCITNITVMLKRYFRFWFLTVTRHSSSLRQRLFRLSDPSPHKRLSSLSIKSCRRQNKRHFLNQHLLMHLWFISCTPFFYSHGTSSHTFILCSALSNPMSMLMMSKPDADLFFWWTPRKSAQRVWEKQRKTEVTKCMNNVKCLT